LILARRQAIMRSSATLSADSQGAGPSCDSQISVVTALPEGDAALRPSKRLQVVAVLVACCLLLPVATASPPGTAEPQAWPDGYAAICAVVKDQVSRMLVSRFIFPSATDLEAADSHWSQSLDWLLCETLSLCVDVCFGGYFLYLLKEGCL